MATEIDSKLKQLADQAEELADEARALAEDAWDAVTPVAASGRVNAAEHARRYARKAESAARLARVRSEWRDEGGVRKYLRRVRTLRERAEDQHQEATR